MWQLVSRAEVFQKGFDRGGRVMKAGFIMSIGERK